MGPRYDYEIPNDPASLTNWARETQAALGQTSQFGTLGGSRGGIKQDFRVIEGQHGNFVRFKFGYGGEQILWDLRPGPAHEFGRTYFTEYQAGSVAGIGPEIYAAPGKETGKGRGREIDLSFYTSTEALANYVGLALGDPGLKAIYPKDAMKRLGLLLYKGSQFELPVTGGQIGYNPYHSETFVNAMTSTVSVGIHPEIRDRKQAIRSIYNAASSAMVEDPGGKWSSLGQYVPQKATQDIIRLHHQKSISVLGERGDYDLSLMGMTTQAKTGQVEAATEWIKRQPYSWMARGRREEAWLMGYTENKGYHEVQPTPITDRYSQPGWKTLNMLLPGETKPPVAYVRPNYVFTPASPLSGYGVIYGPEGFPKEAVGVGQRSHHEQAIPEVGVQNIPSMEMEFGIFKRKEVEGAVSYEKMRELKGARIGAHESAIIGIMRYSMPDSGERVTQEIGYSSGATETFFRDLPTLKLPRQYNVASGEGRSGFSDAPGAQHSFAVAQAAAKKFGIEAWPTTKQGAYLDFPTAFGVNPSLKAFGSKIGMQQLELPTGLQRGQEAPLVTVGGEKVPASGVTGELKARIPQIVGLFGAGWHEQQVEMMGEIANIPDATPEMKALSGSLQEYLRRDKMGYYKREPGKPDLGVMGKMFSAYAGLPYSETTSMEMLFDLVRRGIERPGYEVQAYEKYGHTKLGKEWYNIALSGPEGYKAFRRGAIQGAELAMNAEDLSLKTLKGRRRFRELHGSLDNYLRSNRELTQGLREPLGTGPVGYLEYKSRGLMSTLVSALTPEYQSNIPKVGYEERKAIDIAFPKLGQMLGTSLMMGSGGVQETGYGFERPEIGGWRQVNQLARSIKQEKSRFGTIRPVGAIDLTPELADDLKIALASSTPRELDLNVLEEAIDKKYGAGEQILWNPKTKKAMLRPSAILRTATAKFPEATPFFDPLSTLRSSYPYAFEEWLEGGGEAPTEFEAAQEQTGLLKTSLQSFYRDVTQIFASQSRKVEQQLQSVTMAGTIGGRYGFSLMAGLSGAVMTGQASNQMLRNLANQAGLQGEARNDFMRVSAQQLREGPLPSMFWRFPMVQSPGGLIPTNMITTDFLRRRGVHYPEARSVVAGEVGPGSIFASNSPFMAGMQFLPHIGDLDKDPGQLLAMARATRAGLLIPQDPKFIQALSQTGKQTQKQWENILTQSVGNVGLVAGGKLNIMAEGMHDVMTKGKAWNNPAYLGSDPFEPMMMPIPRETVWERSTGIIKAKEGMGVEYNLRRLFESGAAVLGFSGEAIGKGQSSAGIKYQEFLDKISTSMKTVSTMVYSSIFEPERGTGNWELKAKFGETGGWPRMLTYSQSMGQSSWEGMGSFMAAALQKDYETMYQEPAAATYPAFSLAMTEKDIPLLAGMIEKGGTVRKGLGSYIDHLAKKDITWDPTQTVMGLSMLASAVKKGEPWGEKRSPRTVPEMTKEGEIQVPTFEGRMAAQQGIRFFGEDINLMSLPASPQMQAMEATFGFLTRQYPVTMTQSALIYGQSYDFLKSGKDVPIPWRGILSRYPAQQEAAVVAGALAERQGGNMGQHSSAFWLDPNMTKQHMPYYPSYEFQKTGTLLKPGGTPEQVFRTLRFGTPSLDLLETTLPKFKGGNIVYPGSGYKKTPGAATGAPGFPAGEEPNIYGSMGKYIVGESGPETLVFNTPGSIYPANVTKANAMGHQTLMGNWATELAREQRPFGAAGGASGMGGLYGVSNAQIAAAMQGSVIPSSSLQNAPMMQTIYGTAQLAVADAMQQQAANAQRLQVETIRGVPPQSPASLATTLGKAALGVKGLREGPTEGLITEIAGILGEDISQRPERLLLSENREANLPRLQRLYERRGAEVRASSRSYRDIQAAQYAVKSGEAELYVGQEVVTDIERFQGADPRTMGRDVSAAYQGRVATQFQALAAQEGWTAGGKKGEARGWQKFIGDIPEESLKDFSQHLKGATVKLREFADVIEKEGAESTKGMAAQVKMAKVEGGLRRREIGLVLPQATRRADALMEQAIATGDPADEMAALEATREAETLAKQYQAASTAERGGRGLGPQWSQFARRMIGGWGLMYMGHLAQLPMGAYQYGYQERQQYGMGMGAQIGAMGGDYTFGSVEYDIQAAQIAAGGTTMTGFQRLAAQGPPGIKDVTGALWTGAAAAAGALYVSQAAAGIAPSIAGPALAAAPFLGAAGVVGGVVASQVAISMQPEEQTIGTLAGGYLRGGMAGDWVKFWYGGLRPGEMEQGEYQAGQIERWLAGEEALKGYEYTPSTIRRSDSFFGPAAGRPDPFTEAELTGSQMMSAALALVQEPDFRGLPREVVGQVAIRHMAAGATGENILDIVEAQMQGIEVPELAGELLAAGRRRSTGGAGVALEAEIAALPDIYAQQRVRGGIEVMGQLPITTLEGMLGGEGFDLLEGAIELEPWKRTDHIRMLMQEGQLAIGAEGFGLQRSVQAQMENAQLLSKVRSGTATPEEMRALSLSQTKEGRAQLISQQIGYYAPEQAQRAFREAASGDAQKEALWQSAASGLPQAAKLGIQIPQYIDQMTGTLQQNVLGQQALGITGQYAQLGGEDTGAVFGFAAESVENRVRMQRMMTMSPLMFADEALEGVPGMAQFTGTVDIGMGEDITAMGWGTTSLADVAQVAGGMSTMQSSISQATRMWGQEWKGTRGGEAAVYGTTTPFGKEVFGKRAMQWDMRALQWEAQQASFGAAFAQVALQEEYMPKFWAIQDQQRALQHEQRLWGFEMQEQQFQMTGTQFQENQGLQRRGQLMRREWAMEDWGYQDQMRTMQWGWKQEDFQENVRFMTGRQRKLAERQMERETVMYGMQGERIDTQRERQKEGWSLEDARFEMTKKHFQEQRVLQEENMKKQREFYEEGKKLQDEMIRLQREYQMKQLDLQKAAIGAQAHYAALMKEANDLMIALGEEQADRASDLKLVQDRQIDMVNALVGGLNYVAVEGSKVLRSMVDAILDEEKLKLIELWSGPKVSQPGVGGTSEGTGYAIGGPTMPGQLAMVGEGGIEMIKSTVPQHVFPANEVFAAALGGSDNMMNDPWAQTVIGTAGGVSTGGNDVHKTIVINIGNERLGEFVLNTVNDALEVR